MLKSKAVLFGFTFCFAMSGAVGVLAQTPEEGAVWNLRQWECRVDGGRFVVTSKQSLTVFGPRGDKYAYVSLNESDHVKIAEVHAKVMDAAGVVRELRKKDLMKDCGYSQYALYDDDCNYYGDLRGPGYPYTVEIEYKRQAQSLFYWRSVAIQDDIPVTKASYRLDIPSDIGFDYRLYGATHEPTRVVQGTRTLYEWSFDSLPALEDWDYLPPGYNEPITLAFAPQHFELEGYELNEGSWQGIADWNTRLFEKSFDFSGPGLLPGEDTRTAAERIYRNVIGSVRYVAIEIGLGSWQPYKASLTEQRGYGDCKDMATLLVSQLNGAGIEAWPVLIRTKPGTPLDRQFPRIDFNHVIAVALIDGDTVWMDATCNVCPFGELPWSDENVDVLVGGEAGGVVRRTAAPSARDNHTQRRLVFTLKGDGRIGVEASFEIAGNYAGYIRSYYPSLDTDERRQFIAECVPGADKKMQIDAYQVNHLQELDQPVEITVTASTVKPAPRIKGVTYVSPFLCTELSSRERSDLNGRPFPLDLLYRSSKSDHIVVRWDSTVAAEVQAIPDNDSLSFDFAASVLTCNNYGDSVVVDFDKEYDTDIIPVERFDDYQVFRDRLKDIYKRSIKLSVAAKP